MLGGQLGGWGGGGAANTEKRGPAFPGGLPRSAGWITSLCVTEASVSLLGAAGVPFEK